MSEQKYADMYNLCESLSLLDEACRIARSAADAIHDEVMKFGTGHSDLEHEFDSLDKQLARLGILHGWLRDFRRQKEATSSLYCRQKPSRVISWTTLIGQPAKSDGASLPGSSQPRALCGPWWCR